MDIISIYSNLLDNAIDACILCSPEQREIELRCSLHQQNLVIYLKNSKHPDVTIDIKNSTDFLETTITLITE